MGFDPLETIQTVDNIMSHFMNYRITETVLIVFGKQPGVVPYAPVLAANLIHAGTFTPEVKVDRYWGKVTAIAL
jgi:hypothetical protein